MADLPGWVGGARAQWRWRGATRPAFADNPAPGQESVWDWPRPPALVPDMREVVVRWQGRRVARTRSAIRVLETAQPPRFYLPWSDVNRDPLAPAPATSFREWKGAACCWSLVHAGRRLERVA